MIAEDFKKSGLGGGVDQLVVPSVSKEEVLNKMHGQESFQLLFVLRPLRGQKLIRGSKVIPINEVEDRLNELQRNIPVIVYSVGEDCEASKQAARILLIHGFQVGVYEGGTNEWLRGGLPTQTHF